MHTSNEVEQVQVNDKQDNAIAQIVGQVAVGAWSKQQDTTLCDFASCSYRFDQF
jgi:hypothetical protein